MKQYIKPAVKTVVANAAEMICESNPNNMGLNNTYSSTQLGKGRWEVLGDDGDDEPEF